LLHYNEYQIDIHDIVIAPQYQLQTIYT
jgi:hypothetical protein